jgi:D-alanyl-D-alanine carboxypeptidase/D-alanyl-D-alanine-endopeptidase (penicillin-binding protein 4)
MIKKMQNIMRTLRITGNIVIHNTKRKLPANAVLVNTINSKPLSVILPPALKKSDNLTFDSLYLTIIHSIAPTNIKKWEDGDKIVKELMQKYFAVNLDKALIVDGSGVSRYNRIQPSQLFEILRKGYAVSEFVNALPYPGEVNSTLKERGSILAAELRAKSGKMSGISCLCGYKLSAEHPQAFVIVASSFAPPLRDIFPVIDEFVNGYLVR